ncbi:MAG TPA: isoprenylcysteine carboxylmethyltransferase family protein [Terrimicrobiaceae bacterium]|nr:isoprenylcysteine carboxylmethyltransferase family protein [Terrimicrobiaceae bacterium]
MAQGALLSAIVFLAARSRGRTRSPIAVSTGTTLLGLGTGIIAAGAAALGRNLTPFPKPADDAVLVREGVFSLMRHPLYTGVMMISVGWALAWQSAPALMVALGSMPFFDAKARREEQWLREKFPEYRDYQRSVKRFVPGVY